METIIYAARGSWMENSAPPSWRFSASILPPWLATFADLMSLLMCFFVLLLSFSEMDRKKYKMVSGSMKQAFGIQREKPVFESPRGQKMIAKEFDQAVMITKIEEAIKPIIDEIQVVNGSRKVFRSRHSPPFETASPTTIS